MVPNAIPRAVVPVPEKVKQLRSNPFNAKVPDCNDKMPVVVNALPNVVVVPVALPLIGLDSTTPFVVTVPIALNDTVPVADQTVVADKVKLPATVSDPVELNVNELPVVVSDLAVNAPVSVTVPDPDAPSKNASSNRVGGKLPPAPLELCAQLVAVVLSHVPVPPTQYLLPVPKVQPVLLPKLLALVAVKVAPPVVALSCIFA